MRIVSVSMLRNEADIVELFVRHHLQIVDHMILVDHLSSDETPEILAELREEGAPLEIVTETRPQLEQASVTTSLMRRAAEEFGADWVLPLDCDEFLTGEEGDVRSRFAKLVEGRAHRLPWRSYVPTEQDPEEEPHLFRRVTWRRRVEVRQKWKMLVPRMLARHPDVSLIVGNHKLLRRGSDRIKGEVASHLHLAHFPVRSPEQITAKGLLGWASRLASPEQTGEMNWHLKLLFERMRDGRELGPQDLTELALSYVRKPGEKDPQRDLVCDPVRSARGEVILKRPGQRGAAPISVLADLAERLASELAARRTLENELARRR